MERSHEMVARCFGCAVRAMRLVFQVFGEEFAAVGKMVLAAAGLGAEGRHDAFGVGEFECAINLVGRDMVETFAVSIAVPIHLGGLQEAQRTHHIGLREGERVFDGAVHVALGGEVDDAIDLLVLHELVNRLEVADVGLYELIVRLVLDVFQIGKIACVSQLVEVDDFIIGILVHEQTYDMASDEARAASNDNGTFVVHVFLS